MLKAFIASVALVVGSIGVTSTSASAGYANCSSYGGSTYCYGSDGSSYNSNSYGGSTNFYGRDSYGNSYSGSCSSYGGSTSCYSY